MSGRGPESPKGAGQMEYLDKVSSQPRTLELRLTTSRGQGEQGAESKRLRRQGAVPTVWKLRREGSGR